MDDHRRMVIHGPMWQFECENCHFMGDCWDTESEAAAEMEQHDCYETWKAKVPAHILDHLTKERHYD